MSNYKDQDREDKEIHWVNVEHMTLRGGGR